MVNHLLEHVPGSVPYSTHLEIENAREELIARESARAGDRSPVGQTWKRCGGLEIRERCEPDAGYSPLRMAGAKTLYAQRVTRWPLGGLIDLVV